MEKNNTKQEILSVALDLFSTQGYEATSISQIANAVGIKKASMYSHYSSKQEILESLLNIILEEYDKKSLFANANWKDATFTKDKENMTIDDIVEMIIGQINYIVKDTQISKGRKLLTVEQFQNPLLAQVLTKQNYTDVLNYFNGMIRFLISKGKLVDYDAEIMSAQLCLPISVWINICDREPEKFDEIMKLVKKHIKQFFKMYQK